MMSIGCQGCLWLSWALSNLWQCLEYVKGGIGLLVASSGSMFPSISVNFRKSQMRSLTFSSISGGPRCLKYQNVPKIRSFWPYVKLPERFQSQVIIVYFLTVPCICLCHCHCHCHCLCLCICLCQFFWSCHVFSSLWTNVSKVTSL